MRDFILLILCILVTGFIGWNVLYLLCGRSRSAGLYGGEKLGLSYLFGFGVISLQMFIMGLFGIEFTRFNILFPWAFIVAINLLLWGRSSAERGVSRTRTGTFHIF